MDTTSVLKPMYIGIAAIGALVAILLLIAGRSDYWQAWIFGAINIVIMIIWRSSLLLLSMPEDITGARIFTWLYMLPVIYSTFSQTPFIYGRFLQTIFTPAPFACSMNVVRW